MESWARHIASLNLLLYVFPYPRWWLFCRLKKVKKCANPCLISSPCPHQPITVSTFSSFKPFRTPLALLPGIERPAHHSGPSVIFKKRQPLHHIQLLNFIPSPAAKPNQLWALLGALTRLRELPCSSHQPFRGAGRMAQHDDHCLLSQRTQL